uniref:phosphatase PAP2 family protein n=1 Tax=Sulfurospirillum cavolei TaxID=366522 RepID=UPI003FA1DEA8
PYRFKNFKIVFAVGFLSTIVVTHTLKNSVERPRPSFFDTLIDMPLDFSFPSAHTAQITAFTFLVWVLFFRKGSLKSILFSSILLLIAITVASSRIYLQVHFLTDVLAGFLVAILSCFTALLTIKSN